MSNELKIVEPGTALVRANKLAIRPVPHSIEFVAVFHRTHKELGEVNSKDTEWRYDNTVNPTCNREMFRLWITKNADKYGIKWDPENHSDPSVPKTYTPELAMETLSRWVADDIRAWLAKLPGYELVSVVGDGIQPMVKYKDKAVNAYYATGNVAYAHVRVQATIKDKNGKEAYPIFAGTIVSGQMKKPDCIGPEGYHYSGLLRELSVDFPELREKIGR